VLALAVSTEALAQTELLPTPPAASTIVVPNHNPVVCPSRFSEWTNVGWTTGVRIRLVRDGVVLREEVGTGPTPDMPTGHEAAVADNAVTMYCEVVMTNELGAGQALRSKIHVGNAEVMKRQALAVLNDVTFPNGYGTPTRRRLAVSRIDRSWLMRSRAEAHAYRGTTDYLGAEVKFSRHARYLMHYYALSTCPRAAAYVAKISTAKRRIEVLSCRETTLAGTKKARTWIFKTSYVTSSGVPMAVATVETYGRSAIGLIDVVATRTGRASKFQRNLRIALRSQIPFRQRVARRMSLE
jgi:hypothetical protein